MAGVVKQAFFRMRFQDALEGDQGLSAHIRRSLTAAQLASSASTRFVFRALPHLKRHRLPAFFEHVTNQSNSACHYADSPTCLPRNTHFACDRTDGAGGVDRQITSKYFLCTL